MCAKKFAEICFSKRWVRSSSLRKEMASPATEQQPRKSPRGSSSRFDPPNFQRWVCSPREPQTHTNRCLPTPGKLALPSKLACFLLAELAPKEVSFPPCTHGAGFVLHHHFAHSRPRPPSLDSPVHLMGSWPPPLSTRSWLQPTSRSGRGEVGWG